MIVFGFLLTTGVIWVLVVATLRFLCRNYSGVNLPIDSSGTRSRSKPNLSGDGSSGTPKVKSGGKVAVRVGAMPHHGAD